MTGSLRLLYTWSTVNIFLSEKILTVNLGTFFSNLLDLSNLRVLSCSVNRGAGGRTRDRLPSFLRPFQHVDSAIRSLVDGRGQLVQEPGVELFEK